MFSKQAVRILLLIAIVVMVAATISIAAESTGQKTQRLYRQHRQGIQSDYKRKPYVRSSKNQVISQFGIIETTETVEETPVLEKPAPADSDTVAYLLATAEQQETQPEEPQAVQPAAMPAQELPQTIATANPVLNIIPGDSLFCVVINDMDNTLAMTNSYLTPVVPFPVAMMAKMQLGKLLGNEMLVGLDTTGSIAVFARNAEGSPKPDLAIILPVTDYDTFIQSSRNISEPDGNGASTISSPGLDKLKLRKLSENYVVISEHPGVTDISAFAVMADTLDNNEMDRGTTAPLWAYGNLEIASNIFGPMLIAQIQQQMIAAAAMGQKQQTPEEAAAKINMLQDTIAQLASISLTLTPTQNALKLNISFTAKPGSEIANTLRPDPAANPGFQMAGYLNEPAVLASISKTNKPLAKKLIEFFATLSGPNPGLQMAADSLDFIGDEEAFFIELVPQMPFFGIGKINQITDIGAYEQLFQKQVQATAKLLQNAPMNSAPPMLAAFTTSMIPKGQASGNMFITALGADADNRLNLLAVLTRFAPPAPAGDIKVAMDIIDDSQNAGFIASLNLIRVLNSAKNFAPMIPVPQVQMVMGSLANTEIPTQSCIAIAGRTNNGKANLQITLPKQHLQELFGVVMMIQQQMMMQQMQKAK